MQRGAAEIWGASPAMWTRAADLSSLAGPQAAQEAPLDSITSWDSSGEPVSPSGPQSLHWNLTLRGWGWEKLLRGLNRPFQRRSPVEG